MSVEAAIRYLRPGAKFTLHVHADGKWDLTWHGDDAPPTRAEIEAALPAVKLLAVKNARIAALEATQTPRRLREAMTGEAGKAWLADLDAQIAALRK